MARTKFVCNKDYPNGIELPLTPAEEAQRDLDEAQHLLDAAKPKEKSLEQRLAELEAKVK